MPTASINSTCAVESKREQHVEAVQSLVPGIEVALGEGEAVPQV